MRPGNPDGDAVMSLYPCGLFHGGFPWAVSSSELLAYILDLGCHFQSRPGHHDSHGTDFRPLH